MLVGIVGKPNVGKSTFFSAATMKMVPIADYPFTTIEPNIGITYLRVECVCKEFGVTDNPRNSLCNDGKRLIPVKIVDVAGLVEGASRGRGLGNKFLDEIRQADALILVVDASGSTDSEGRKVPAGSHDPIRDIEIVEGELDSWIYGIIMKDWERVARLTEHKGLSISKYLAERLTGLSIKQAEIEQVIAELGLNEGKPTLWSDEQIRNFVRLLRERTKPSVIAANKADLPNAKVNIDRLSATGRRVIPCAAEAELLLRRAAEKGLIDYTPGDSSFKVIAPEKITRFQADALRLVEEKVLRQYGSTGVQRAINEAYFSLLNAVVVYPVEDENRLSDKEGNILPDALVMKGGSTALDLARAIHTELAEGFIYAIDVRSGMRLASDYILKNRDIIKIVSSGRRG